MKINTASRAANVYTHEGAPARNITSIQALRRSVMSCMLWEQEFYEDGDSISERIARLVHEVKDSKSIADCAIEARSTMHLRHVPLLIVREMARNPNHKGLVAKTLAEIIQRPDELTEFLAIYWKDGKQKLSAQVKKGLASAFTKFNAYNLAKYNRDEPIKLRDVLFLCHAKPISKEQESTWKQLVNKTLPAPDTWEVALSAGADKKKTWERLIAEKKLGALALLRNLRNMQEAKVTKTAIRKAIASADVSKVLPFRFIAAARFAPDFEPELEEAMFKSLAESKKIPGETVILVDVSGSMDDALSSKSDMKRIDAACGVAMVARELCQHCSVLSFSSNLVKIPNRRGFALRDALVSSQEHSSTELGGAMAVINKQMKYDRIIVITDEQSHSQVGGAKGKGYMINVASAQNGVGYGPWLHIDGFSEGVMRYITDCEQER